MGRGDFFFFKCLPGRFTARRVFSQVLESPSLVTFEFLWGCIQSLLRPYSAPCCLVILATCHMVFLSLKLFLLLFLVLSLKSCFLLLSWEEGIILLENKSMYSYQPSG